MGFSLADDNVEPPEHKIKFMPARGTWRPAANLSTVLLRDGSAWYATAHACVCVPATADPPLHPPVAVTRPDGDAVRGCAATACVESIRGRIPLFVSGAWVRDQHARAGAQEMSLPMRVAMILSKTWPQYSHVTRTRTMRLAQAQAGRPFTLCWRQPLGLRPLQHLRQAVIRHHLPGNVATTCAP